MNIRYGNPNDARMLSELGARTFYEAFAKENSPENIALYLKASFSPEIQFRELSNPENIFLIAEAESIPIGYAHLVLDSRDESIRGEKPLELRRIYATQQYIGKGVGRELMNAALLEGKRRGCNCIWLGVWEKNQRAIDFYKKCGFREVGTHEFVLGNDLQKDFVMELQLE
ncbi:MAG TPA: GNAT family N-acetyltransferase [Anaerolineales bacterium]|nr:GNAT family N-acetyltransferase [Anaerolineales bacterium]